MWLLYLIAMIWDAGLLGAHLFYIIYYADLQDDYMNPIDLCQTLNPWQVPVMLAHMILTLLFAVFGCFWSVLLNVPILVWNVYIILDKSYIHDSTVIFRNVNVHQRNAFIKLAYYAVMFFVYLYDFVSELAS